jgi:hypothetical protein
MHSRHLLVWQHLLVVQLGVEILDLLVWQIHEVFGKHLHLLKAQIGTLLSQIEIQSLLLLLLPQIGTLLHQVGT